MIDKGTAPYTQQGDSWVSKAHAPQSHGTLSKTHRDIWFSDASSPRTECSVFVELFLLRFTVLGANDGESNQTRNVKNKILFEV